MICQFCIMELNLIGIYFFQSINGEFVQLLPASTHLHCISCITKQRMREEKMILTLRHPNFRQLRLGNNAIDILYPFHHLSQHRKSELTTKYGGCVNYLLYFMC